MEERKIQHYSEKHKILLVGEGDFSFSACLAEAFGTAVNMTATSLDSKASLMSEYRKAVENLNKLESLGCTILHEVDVHRMKQHPHLQYQVFDRIVFNFPHAGFFFREHDILQIWSHQKLVQGFFRNAKEMIHVNGEIHVTHKTSHPYCEWEIMKLAEDVGLRLVDEVSFSIRNYPGYVNKRGDGLKCDRSFPVGACSTFKFSL